MGKDEGGNYNEKDLEANQIESFLEYYAPTTRRNYLFVFKDIAKFLFEEEKLSKMEFRRIKQLKGKKGRRIRKTSEISPQKYNAILKRLSGDLGLAAAWYLAWNFGLRPQEIVTMQVDDIDFENMLLQVKRRLKTQNSERCIPIRPQQVSVLQNMVAGLSHSFLVLNAWKKPYASANSLVGSFCAYIKKYLDNIKPCISLYDGRYSFATRLEKAGVPLGYISVMMGHGDTAMTVRYLSRNEKRAQAAFRKAFA